MAIIDNNLFTQTNPSGNSPRNNPSLAGEITNLNNEVNSIEDTLVQGYVRESATVAYVNASSFTVSGDKTDVYTAGRIVRFSDGTTAVVSSSSYSAPNTTVNITDGTVPSTLSYVDISLQSKGGTSKTVIASSYQAKDSGGTARNILKVNSSNILELGNSNLLGFQNNLPYADLSSLSRQAIINGAFDVWQRGTSFTPNDDTYTADRWNFLTETNGAWTVAQDTDVPIGFTYSAKFSNVTANNQCAIVQFLEYKDAKKLVGKNVSFSFYAKTVNGEIANLRAAVLSWTGTADNLTSDVIATWASDGANPTWATNWTMENTPSNLALTNSWTRYTLTANIDTTGTNNIAVIIWVDDGTIAAGDDFWITGVQLNEGLVALPFYPKSYEDELRACQRYYYQITSNIVNEPMAVSYGLAPSDYFIDTYFPLKVQMRTIPTLIYSSLSHFQGSDGSFAYTSLTSLSIVSNQSSTTSVNIRAEKTGAFTQYRPYRIEFSTHPVGAYIGFDAEL